MNDQPPNYTVESLYRQFQPTLVGYLEWAFPKLSVEKDAEEVVQNLFITLQRRDTRILGDVLDEDFSVEAALKIHAFRHAIDFLRRKNALKRGSEKISSLDLALEFGFEPIAAEKSYLDTVEELQIVDQVLAEAKPTLSDRELVIAVIIRRNLPDELSNIQIRMEMNPIERLHFLPVRRDTTLVEAEIFIISQISRSKSSLQKKLRETRDSLGF